MIYWLSFPQQWEVATGNINYLGTSALYFQVLMLQKKKKKPQAAKLAGTAHTLNVWELSTT